MNTGFCDRHQYPYGAADTSGPICPWCERLRVEQLQAEVRELLETRGDLERQLTEICTDNLTLIRWLQSAKYRTLMHRHDGTFRAVDEVSQERFSADTFGELAEMLASIQVKSDHEPIYRMPEAPTGILKSYAYTGELDKAQLAFNSALALAERVVALDQITREKGNSCSP